MASSPWIHLLRLGALPILYVLLHQQEHGGALLLFLALFLLDFFLAAFFHKHPVGSFLEPFSEKVFILVSLLFFVWRGEISLLLFGFFVLREMVVILLHWWAAHDEIILPEGKAYGNIAHYTQYALVIILLSSAFLQVLQPFVFFVKILAALSAVLSLAISIFLYRSGLRRILQGSPVQNEHLVVLANRLSSGYKDLYRRRLLRTFCRRRNAELIFLAPLAPPALAPLASQENSSSGNLFSGIEKQAKRARQWIIAGGDGSFESALNYRPFWKKCLGFFPFGAGNFYYSYFYRGKRFEYLRSRFQFRETQLDILEVEWEGGKRQTGLLSLGLDAEVMRLTKKGTRRGLWLYVAAGWRSLWTAQAKWNVRCRAEGREERYANLVTLTVAKVPYFGFGLRGIVGTVEPADGKVYGCAIVNAHHPLWNKPLRAWALIFALFNVEKAPFIHLQGKDLEVESAEPFPLQAGGDFLGYTHWIKVRVIRKQKVLVI